MALNINAGQLFKMQEKNDTVHEFDTFVEKERTESQKLFSDLHISAIAMYANVCVHSLKT